MSICNVTSIYFNGVQGPLIYKVTDGPGGTYRGPKLKIWGGGSELKILKANKGAKVKKYMPKRAINKTNCSDFI